MRYICHENSETAQLLRRWSPDVLVAKHFFWNSGTQEQRSQEGLFRCLLFEILDQRRDLIREVFPEQWRQNRSLGMHSRSHRTWSLSTLKKGFQCLTQRSTKGSKMCFFVDGLDECEGTEESGNHRTMGEFLMSMTSPFVKICLSSRPWRVFTDIFSQCPRLRLQDLTEHDIRIFVTDELTHNGRMKALQDLGPGSSTDLVDEIVSRAEGVFLWVTLVLKSIVNGVGRHETVPELRNRLRSVPSDLRDFYDHLFTRVDPSDMRKAAQIIQIFEASGYHASVMRLGFALEATYEKAMSNTWQEWSSQDVSTLQERTVATLESTCLGFIEIHEDPCGVYGDGSGKDFGTDSWSSDEQLLRLIEHLALSRLYYVHRTAREYIQREETKEKLLLHTRSLEEFDPILSNVMASILLCKALPPTWHVKKVLSPGQLEVCSREFGWHHSVLKTRHWDCRTRSRHNHLLNLLFCLQYNIMRYGKASLSDKDFIDTIADSEARRFEAEFFLGAISYGYTSWAMQRLKLIRRFPEPDRPLLSSVFGGGKIPHANPEQFHLFYAPECLEFVEFMLEHGANVNEAWSEDEPRRTIWGVMLISLENDLEDASDLLSDEELQLRVQYMCSFLEHGANTEIELKVPYDADMKGEEQHLVSVESVIARLEALEVEGIDQARYLFEKHRARGWKNTEPTCYREVGSNSSGKRPREERYLGEHHRGTMSKRANKNHFHRY